MISWKYTFKRLNEEYEIANKKKNVLDKLYETGKISQTTRDSFNSDIASTIAEIERQQKDLVEKMNSKTNELSNQIGVLETLLANFEIQYVAGEIEENLYQKEISLIATGLTTAKNELDMIKQATTNLFSPVKTFNAPETPVIEIPTVSVVTETVVENVAPINLTLVAEPIQAPIQMVAADAAPAADAIEAAPLINNEPQLININEPQEPQIEQPAIQEPIIAMEAAAIPAEHQETAQPSIEITSEGLQVVQFDSPVEQIVAPVEGASIESHPTVAPQEAPLDTIAQIIEAVKTEEIVAAGMLIKGSVNSGQ